MCTNGIKLIFFHIGNKLSHFSFSYVDIWIFLHPALIATFFFKCGHSHKKNRFGRKKQGLKKLNY